MLNCEELTVTFGRDNRLSSMKQAPVVLHGMAWRGKLVVLTPSN